MDFWILDFTKLKFWPSMLIYDTFSLNFDQNTNILTKQNIPRKG